jgi:hypothetical protein
MYICGGYAYLTRLDSSCGVQTALAVADTGQNVHVMYRWRSPYDPKIYISSVDTGYTQSKLD